VRAHGGYHFGPLFTVRTRTGNNNFGCARYRACARGITPCFRNWNFSLLHYLLLITAYLSDLKYFKSEFFLFGPLYSTQTLQNIVLVYRQVHELTTLRRLRVTLTESTTTQVPTVYADVGPTAVFMPRGRFTSPRPSIQAGKWWIHFPADLLSASLYARTVWSNNGPLQKRIADDLME